MKKHLFIDRVQIRIQAGKGGNGSSHFLREKFVPLGGPDGGDGGHGGNVIFVVDDSLRTLVDFSFRKEFVAADGDPGTKKKRSGRQAPDCLVPVPVGTMVFSAEGELVADLSESGQQVVMAKGGRGGRGNIHFVTSTRQAPTLSEKGEPGEERTLVLELKLLADVGVIGLPNAGKSTLLAAVSAANPKIADYPFTTITPNLGVVKIDEGASFVMVDIPGLIEGASQGSGLGHDFLRHVERTKLLIHVVDIGFPEVHPLDDFDTINRELELYNPKLARRPQVVALNKADLLSEPKVVKKLKAKFEAKGVQVFVISAALRQGVIELVQQTYALLQSLPDEPLALPTAKKVITGPPPRFTLESIRPGYWRVTGKEVEKWVAMTEFDNDEAVAKLKNIFDRIGLSEEFVKQQVAEGDTIVVGKEEFLFKADL